MVHNFLLFRVGKILFKVINNFIQQGCINLIKFQNISVSIFYSSENPEKKCQSLHQILNMTAVFNIYKIYFLSQNQHICMISEGSRDTEDWNNNAEKAALNSNQGPSGCEANVLTTERLCCPESNTLPYIKI